MRRIFGLLKVALFLCLTVAPASAQQDEMPGFRYVATQGVDFYGSDLDALFDTDLDSCVRSCSNNSQCVAFTFNSRSNACFPKSAVSDQTPYEGAISVLKTPVPEGTLDTARDRAAGLTFLRPQDLQRSYDQARDLGLRHRVGGYRIESVLDSARARQSAGDLARAASWTGAAVVLSDRDDLWVEYARLLMATKTDDSGRKRSYPARATSAAINGYLRGRNAGVQVSALMVLAEALERSGRGRDMLPVLRLAEQIQPRDDVARALENAIGKYGFRVTDSNVESDSAAPRICVEFSDPLVKAGIDYETFVRLPTPGLVVQTDGRQLCVDGVKHGSRYRLTLRAGLPSASGEELIRDTELTHYVRDRSPAVRFPGRAYVLPKFSQASLPIETVNLNTVDLRLRRISDRNLLRAVQDGYFGRPLSPWEDEEFAGAIAEEIWSGTGEVQNDLNRDMTTRLPLTDAIAGQPAGIYALTATVPGADPYDTPAATQWFVLSDLGLSTMSGVDGLHVQVQGLGDAAPRGGIKLSLISRANAVLAQQTTNPEGYARFEPGLTRGTGVAAPAMLIAEQGEADIGFLSLTDPGFDLSDRGVEGRAPAGPVDVFLTTDRGVYRAGETIHVTALSRDGEAQAIDGLPLTAILSRPDGVEYLRRVSDGGHKGGHVFALAVGASAPRGTWRLDIKTDPKAPALASQQILVEDFLPERIDFNQGFVSSDLIQGETVKVKIAARYLFGAPGSGLKVEGQIRLTAAKGLDAWPGYRFGRYDSVPAAQSGYFGSFETDAQGQAVALVEIPQAAAPGHPLEATIITRVADGSARPVERRLVAPVRPASPLIGIKPLFEDVVAEGSDARFEVVALSQDLTPIDMQVQWTLNRVETRYQWYQLYGNWNWEPTTRRTRIATGEGELGAVPLSVSAAVDWGRYELVVERLDGTYAAAALDFYAGWYAPADTSSTPDRLNLSLDAEAYQPGDIAKLRIVPQAAGTALISVMSNRLIERRAIEVPVGASVIPLTVTEDWGSGAYVSAMVVRPMASEGGQTPARALGVAHASVAQPGRRLDVSIDVPKVARPRGTQSARVTVKGAAPGNEVWITLAAVDLGILNMTAFESPDPSEYYFGQRRLGLELRDVYGRLIDASNGAMGTVRSGGDDDSGRRIQSPPPTQDLMAVFSGAVQIGPDGDVDIPINLPAFNGTVRLMAVAWSGRAVGQAEHDMLVRDPVVVTASLPRFLAPEDQSRVLLDIVHADGPTGDMKLSLRSESSLELGPTPSIVTLDQGGKVSLEIPVTAKRVGDPTLDVALTTPDGQVLKQELRLPIRANDPVIAQTRRFSLAAGDSFAFSSDVFANLRAGTGKAVLSAGPLAKFDAPGLLSALDAYPYGCTEQVTSRAMPLLYLSSVAQATGLGDGPAVQARIDASISRILTRQASNGAFGLWRAESGDFWLDAYATDFLSRAQAEGHQVPERAFRAALDNLRNRINYAPDFDLGGRDIAYALLVLAREGAAAMGDLRYYADFKGDAFDTSLAAAQLGAALAAYGDQTRADRMFARAAWMIGNAPTESRLWRADYGTDLRDAASVLALATEAGSKAIDPDALGQRLIRPASQMSTQEAAWTLLAAQALIESPDQSGLSVNGQPSSGPFVQVLEDGGDTSPVEIAAVGGQATEITLTTLGVPDIAPEAGGTGYQIDRSYYTMDGAPHAASAFAVGERFVTVLTVTASETGGARLMINDPLPAGLEIDNPSLLRSGDVRMLDWLDLSDATHSEFRSDRFLAAVDLRRGQRVTLAYVGRAVMPGQFHHPAASVEDMYRPRYRARTATGQVVVQP
jgi:alpha-2-macroglobulin